MDEKIVLNWMVFQDFQNMFTLALYQLENIQILIKFLFPYTCNLILQNYHMFSYTCISKYVLKCILEYLNFQYCEWSQNFILINHWNK